MSVPPSPTPAQVEAAMRRVKAVWVGRPGQPGRLVATWWSGSAAWVLCGPGEADLDLADGEHALVRTSGLAWPATVRVVAPGSPQWPALRAALPRERLNPPDGLAAAARRWDRARILGLVPLGGDPPLGDPPLGDT